MRSLQRLGIEEEVQKLNVVHVAGTKGKVRPWRFRQQMQFKQAVLKGSLAIGLCDKSIWMNVVVPIVTQQQHIQCCSSGLDRHTTRSTVSQATSCHAGREA